MARVKYTGNASKDFKTIALHPWIILDGKAHEVFNTIPRINQMTVEDSNKIFHRFEGFMEGYFEATYKNNAAWGKKLLNICQDENIDARPYFNRWAETVAKIYKSEL